MNGTPRNVTEPIRQEGKQEFVINYYAWISSALSY